jgi:hypothetical protein
MPDPAVTRPDLCSRALASTAPEAAGTRGTLGSPRTADQFREPRACRSRRSRGWLATQAFA